MSVISAWKQRGRWLLASLIGVTAVALSINLPAPWPQILAFLLLFIWPVLSWAGWLSGPADERLVATAALVLLLNTLLILLLSYLPGVMLRPVQLALHALLALFPLWPSKQKEPAGQAHWRPLLLVLLLAAVLRLPNLGYSEFQGDEGVIMVRAAAVITGDDAELFLHQKGPAEILLPLGLWSLAESIDEFWARLPFTWAGILFPGALFLLARRWLGVHAAIWTGILSSLVGFGVAFSRIVQYQSLVMLWGVMALLHADRYAEEKRRTDLWLTAVFLAGGLLAHYDAILVAPAVGWLLLHCLWQTKRIDWRGWGLAVAIGGLALASFYGPFVLNPNAARTGRYLLQDRLGGGAGQGWLNWSGSAVWQMATFYNSLYFVAGLVALAVLGLVILGRRRQGGTAVLYFATPLLFYLLIVADPRTHIYTIFPGAVLLAAVGTAAVGQTVRGRIGRYAGIIGVLGFFLLSANYDYLMFVDHTPERQRTWAENRPAGYPTTWSEPPLYGLFGFPHQAGWRVAPDLLPEYGYPYASNEEREVTNWYMSQSPRTHCPNFQTFILAEDAQDEVPYSPDWMDELNLQGRVMVNGRPALQIFGRQPVEAVQTYEAAGKTAWRTPGQVAPPLRIGAYPVNIILGDDQVKLLGYDLDTKTAVPGDQIVVTLYWQALAPFDRNYQAFVHLYDGQIRAQHDSAPECAQNPTTRWEPGQIIADPHILSVPADLNENTIPMLVGMYDLITNVRLAVPMSADNTIHLTDISAGSQ